MGKKHRRHKKAEKADPKRRFITLPDGKRVELTKEMTECPVCLGHVNVEATSKGPRAAITAEIWANLPPETPETLAKLREVRGDKKTLCILGTSPDNCNLAPWGDGLDMWGVNDAHRLAYMEGHIEQVTGWFQMHHRWRFMATKAIPGSERMRYGGDHWKFLLEDTLNFPLYMQRHYEDIPRSVEYPLKEITEALLFKKLQRGWYWQRKYYTCSFAYMAALAIWSRTPKGQDFFKHDGYERVELYGVQLAQQIEYMQQKPSTEFWIGMMVANGMEIYVPTNGYLLSGETYGYRNPHGDPSLGQMDEENIGYWDWGDGVPDFGQREKLSWG